MMDKESYIISLKGYIEASKFQLNSLLSSLEFSSCNSNEGREGFDLDNAISSLQNHVLQSELSNSKNYGPELPCPIPKSFLPCENVSYRLDEETRKSLLLPLREDGNLPELASTSDDYQANYSTVEKNVLHDHALRNTVKIVSPPELIISEPTETKIVDESKLSEEELRIKSLEAMKKERDLRRRRMAYRRKVSTKNKSYTEVTREMISNIMEALFSSEKDQDPNEQAVENMSESTIETSENSYWKSKRTEDEEKYKYDKSDNCKDLYKRDGKSRTDEKISSKKRYRDRYYEKEIGYDKKRYRDRWDEDDRSRYRKRYEEKGHKDRSSQEKGNKDKERIGRKHKDRERKEKKSERREKEYEDICREENKYRSKHHKSYKKEKK